MNIAIIGTGISGNVCGYLLADDHDLTLYEASDHIGGHSHTISIPAYGTSYDVDTGFMVFNHRTYPNFVRLLEQLGVAEQSSDMSFSVRCSRSGLEYQGSSLNGVFAQRRNLLRPAFWRMLSDIVRFNREAPRFLMHADDRTSMRSFVESSGYRREFVDHYLIPMGSAIWSARPDRFLDFPAHFLIQFFHKHGLLQVRNQPQWKTVAGRSRSYVTRLTAGFRGQIRLQSPVTEVSRHLDHVVVRAKDSMPEIYDAVIFATHADQTLEILADPTELEKELLGEFRYQSNETIVHTDSTILPRSRRAWASWNYHIPSHGDSPVAVTYDVNRLQRLGAPGPICVTLNDTADVDADQIIRRITYHHPVFTAGAIAAQSRHDEINGVNRSYFCGAYWGYGFHEDGVNSALTVARHFEKHLDSEKCTAVCTTEQSNTAD